MVSGHIVVAPNIHPNLAEVYRRKVAELHEALDDQEIGVEAFELIRSLIDTITLTPQNDHLRPDLRGDPAGILNLCSESKKPASNVGDGLKQIKMVAGVSVDTRSDPNHRGSVRCSPFDGDEQSRLNAGHAKTHNCTT